ncbi:MAG: hypothetical protein MUC76_14985 [Spirochaetes bacterium]|nr:hypothetical protein [Spirochaetota bacterium]
MRPGNLRRTAIFAPILLVLLAHTGCLRQYDEPALIAFSRNLGPPYQEEIFVMDADGSSERRLTVSPERMYRPSWSPDGSKIAYYEDTLPTGNVFTMDADGGSKRYLCEGSSPTWSPDGRRLVLSRSGDLIVINAGNGGGEFVLTAGMGDTHPSWSPDGKRIAFLREIAPQWHICTVNSSDGGMLFIVKSDPGIPDDSSPSWSPDGTKILYTIGPDIGLIHADGTNDQIIIAGAYAPSWSPDGTGIYYTRAGDLCRADADGSNERQLTATSVDYFPCYQGKPR